MRASVSLLALVSTLASFSAAIPVLGAAGKITPVQILAIAPSSANCTAAEFPEECRTAFKAACPLNAGFAKYNITAPKTKAALLALMLYESGNFQYNKNHYPGVPGQGTRNMQSPAFNLKYAQSLYDNATVSAAEAQGPEAVLQLVSGDEPSFASAAWFVTTQCESTISDGLAGGTQAGWEAYLTTCIGTTVNDDRNAIWQKALGVIAK